MPCFLFFGKTAAASAVAFFSCKNSYFPCYLYIACMMVSIDVNIYLRLLFEILNSSDESSECILQAGLVFSSSPTPIHQYICDAKLTNDVHRLVRDIKKETIT